MHTGMSWPKVLVMDHGKSMVSIYAVASEPHYNLNLKLTLNASVMAHVEHRGFTRQAAAAAALPPLLTYVCPKAHQTVNVRHLQTCRALLQGHDPRDTQVQQQRLGQQEQHQQQSQDDLRQGPPASPAIDDWCQRSRLLVGNEGLARLASLNVLLVGLGGVGSFTGEWCWW